MISLRKILSGASLPPTQNSGAAATDAEGCPHPVVTAQPGPSLGSGSSRQRRAGRIGGIIGPANPSAIAELTRALGPGGAVLPHASAAGGEALAVIADWDCCDVGGRPLEAIDHWRTSIASGQLPDVSGAFAIAWRDREGTLRLARDAVGERTLYYAPLPHGLVFASTIHAILATGLAPRTLHLPSLAAFLSYAYLPGRETMVAGIYELLPGEMVECRGATLSRTQVWSPPPEQVRQTAVDQADLCRNLRHALEAAVSRRLPVGEPVGAFLSGGLDSSLVVALARRLHPHPVLTYSISFGAGYANELPFSSLVARHCHTDHRIVELSPAVVQHHLDDSIGLLSEPIGDPLTVPNALLFRAAADQVGAVLNGEGGDPCFGGPKNLPMLLAEWLGDGHSSDDQDGYRRERSYLRAHQKCYDDLPKMLSPDVVAAVGDDNLEKSLQLRLDDPRWTNFVTRLMAVNVTCKGGHHILPKVDALSAPFGVMARSPLFDRDVVELAFRIPPQLKLAGSVEKHLLKRAVADLLPELILKRPKSGMLVPVESWFQGPLLPHARERLLDGLAASGLFQQDYLQNLLAGKLGGVRPRHGAKIWLLLTLEAWLRRVLWK